MPAFEMPNMGGSTLATKLVKKMILDCKNGVFAACSRLPSETELAERFGVSRSVIRDVLSNLEQIGFVERVRGIGTMIHRDIVNLDSRLDLKFEYSELIQNVGCRPSCDNVRLHTGRADDDLAEKLEIDAAAAVIICEKRVLASGRPVIYSCDYIPESFFSHMDYTALDWREPVFNLLEEHCGLAVDGSVTKLTATNGPPHIRKQLEIGGDEALIMLDEISYYKLSRPILQTYAHYTNFFEFTILRKKL